MGGLSKRKLHLRELSIRRKRAKRDEACTTSISSHTSSELHSTVDVNDVQIAENIEDLSSEDEEDIEISDSDEPEFDQYVPSSHF